MNPKVFCRAGLLFFGLALLSCGCFGPSGPKTYPVRGKVTYKGKAITSGTVSFHSSSGQTATGELKADGTYQLKTFRSGDGAVAGEHKVVIVAMEDMSGKLPEQRSGTPPSTVPDKYTSIATTDLRATVTEGDNNIDFPLEDKKR